MSEERVYAKKKNVYFTKLINLFSTYDNVLLCDADNVASKQFQDIRIALRGKAEILMGKNTMVRRCLRNEFEKGNLKRCEQILDLIKLNVGFVFTNASPSEVQSVIQNSVRGAPAKSGALAPLDVFVPAGDTGLEPTQTSFFQALNVPTKINKGQIEILKEVQVLIAGERVGPSQAALLAKMKITPFEYGLDVLHVLEGDELYSAEVLAITDAELTEKFMAGVQNIACVSLAAGYPTAPAVPHLIINGFKNCVAAVLDGDYSFPAADKIKDMLANPDAYASAAAPSGGGGGGGGAAAPAPEPEEESDEDMGFGLFD